MVSLPFHSCVRLLSKFLVTGSGFIFFFFFLNDTATTEFSPLPLHDALPIPRPLRAPVPVPPLALGQPAYPGGAPIPRLVPWEPPPKVALGPLPGAPRPPQCRAPLPGG